MKLLVYITGWHREVLGDVLKGIISRSKEEEVDVHIFNCYGEYNEESPFSAGEYNIFRLPEVSDYDGAIIVSQTIVSKRIREEIQRRVRSAGIPSISVGEDVEGIDFLGINNYSAMYELVSHVIKVHGVRDFCYIGGPTKGFESEQRYKAFSDALNHNDITLRRDLYYVKDYRYLSGEEVLEDLWQKYEDICDMPKAIICANDEMAMGVCEACERRNIRVPEDIIVTGFDNYSRSAEYSPRLTSVDRPKDYTGYVACDHIIRKAKGEEVPLELLLETKTIYGETCGCNLHEVRDNDAYRKKAFRMQNEKIFFEQHLHAMEEELIAGMSQEDFENTLCKYLPYTKAEAFYMVTKEERGEDLYAMQMTSRSRGYGAPMNLRIDWSKEERGPKKTVASIHAVLKKYDQKKGGNVFLFEPLHFQEKTKGYCVFVNSTYLVENEFMSSWLKTVDNTMENFSQKRKLFEANEKLNNLYIKDSLTGLYNRFGYAQEAITLFEKNKKEGKDTLVIFADLDGLKCINDTYGHEYGDIAIISVASTIKRVFPEEYIKIRYGGDEFLVVGTCKEDVLPEELLMKVEEDFCNNHQNNVFPFSIGASMGYVVANPRSELPLYDFVQMADNRMYEVKQSKRDNACRTGKLPM